MTERTDKMHAIVENDPQIKAAQAALADLISTEATYVANVRRIKAEQEEARYAAIRRGEVYDPQPVMPAEVSAGYFEAERRNAKDALDLARGERAVPLLRALAEREREVLADLRSGKAANAPTAASELQSLVNSALSLLEKLRSRMTERTADQNAGLPSREELKALSESLAGVHVTTGEAVEVALGGGSLLGPLASVYEVSAVPEGIRQVVG
jgi:chorismate mutase